MVGKTLPRLPEGAESAAVKANPGGVNERHGFAFSWETNGGMRIRPTPDRNRAGLKAMAEEDAGVRIRVAEMGFGDALQPLPEPEGIVASPEAGLSAVRPGIRETYADSEAGLDHGFVVAQRPEGGGNGRALKIAVGFQTGLRPQLENADSLLLSDADGQAVWSYRRLVVEDARQKRLPAWMEFRTDRSGEPQVLLCMAESDATYPLLIDPTFASVERGALGNPPQTTANLNSFKSSVVLGDAIYFSASDGVYGEELWKSDLVTGQTSLLKDIYPGAEGSYPSASSGFPVNFPLFKGQFYFAAREGISSSQLWRSDGTAGGTSRFYDFTADLVGSPSDFVVAGEYLYFRVYSNIKSTYQFWRTDGSTGGTTRIIEGGATVPDLSLATALGGLLIYPSKDALHGEEIWCSDGSAAGTRLLKDIVPGTFGSRPGKPERVGNKVYFVVQEASAFRPELWVTDGTPDGTLRVPTGESVPGTVLDFGGIAVFHAASPALPAALWRTDGTAEGTRMIRNLSPDAANAIQMLAATDSFVYFAYYTQTEAALWKTDGTSGGTVKVKSLGNTEVTVARPMVRGDRMFLEVGTPANGLELWVTDGSAAGTVLVKDINPGSAGSDPFPLLETNGLLVFTADDGLHGKELWKTDGTAGGTVMVRDVFRPSNYLKPSDIKVVGNSVLFQAYHPDSGRELWMYDGTSRQTRLVKDLVPGPGSGFSPDLAQQFAAAGGILYFAPNSEDLKVQSLWRSDGTAGGTVRLKDNISFPRLGNVSQTVLVPLGNLLLFTDWAAGQVWRSDGSPEGTFSLGAGALGISVNQFLFYPGNSVDGMVPLMRTDGTLAGTWQVSPPGLNVSIFQSMAAGGNGYFMAATPANGSELWKTDGTEAGTAMVRDLTPGPDPSSLTFLGSVGNRLYFRKYVGQTGELWSTDGSSAGTLKMMNLALGTTPAAWPAQKLLYFVTNGTTTGAELWRSDGTAAGTFRLRGFFITNATYDRRIVNLTTIGDKLFFLASTEAAGHELWVSDGTVGGTQLLADILPGAASSLPAHLGNGGKFAYFAATDATHGREVWVSDGTPAGTRLVEDLNPGSDSSAPFWAGEAAGKVIAMYEQDPASGGTGVREIIVTPVPVVVTGPAGSIRADSAVLTGQADPDSGQGSAYFEYGPTTEYGSRTPSQAISQSGPVTAAISGLPPGGAIHYRLVYASGDTLVAGADLTLRTRSLKVFAGADSNSPEILDGQTTAAFDVRTPEGTGVSALFTLSNPGTDPLEITQITLPTGFTLTQPAPPVTLAGESSLGFGFSQFSATPGVFSGNVTISTGGGFTPFTFPVSVTVFLVNDAPVIVPPPLFHTPEDTPFTGLVTAADPDAGQVLKFSLAGNVSNGSATVTEDGHFTFVPAANFSGTATIPVKVNDTLVDSETVNITIEVLAVADPPVLDPVPLLTTPEDTLITGKLSGKSGEGLNLTFSLAEAPDPASGSLTVFSDGTFLFQPAKDFNGAAGFFVKASDGIRDSGKMLVVILITPVNDAPVLVAPGAVMTVAGMTRPGIPLSATDSDSPPGTLQWSFSSDNPALLPASSLQISGSGGTRALALTPAAGVSGKAQVTISASDGQLSVSRVMEVQVLANQSSLVRSAGGQIQARFTGVPQLPYVIQRSADLVNWTELTTVTPGQTGEVNWTDPSPLPKKGYYRLSGPR